MSSFDLVSSLERSIKEEQNYNNLLARQPHRGHKTAKRTLFLIARRRSRTDPPLYERNLRRSVKTKSECYCLKQIQTDSEFLYIEFNRNRILVYSITDDGVTTSPY